jgi:hypothetical protein
MSVHAKGITMQTTTYRLESYSAYSDRQRLYSNSRYPSVNRASQTCEGFDFYGHNPTLQALKACPNTA